MEFSFQDAFPEHPFPFPLKWQALPALSPAVPAFPILPGLYGFFHKVPQTGPFLPEGALSSPHSSAAQT